MRNTEGYERTAWRCDKPWEILGTLEAIRGTKEYEEGYGNEKKLTIRSFLSEAEVDHQKFTIRSLLPEIYYQSKLTIRRRGLLSEEVYYWILKKTIITNDWGGQHKRNERLNRTKKLTIRCLLPQVNYQRKLTIRRRGLLSQKKVYYWIRRKTTIMKDWGGQYKRNEQLHRTWCERKRGEKKGGGEEGESKEKRSKAVYTSLQGSVSS